MIKILRFAAAILAGAIGAPAIAADAGSMTAELTAQAEALGRCFVGKSTGDDRVKVAQWMLAALASGPAMADTVKVDPVRKIELDKNMAVIFTRLMTVDCASEARPLFKANSSAGFETAGSSLGQIAVRELLSNPAATQALEAYAKYLKDSDFADLAK